MQVFLYIDLSIFNGLVLPRAGAILFRFRWASDAVRACCHSVQLKSESVRPWKCINGHPRGKSHVHQFWASDEKKKKVLVLDGLCWANICKVLLKITFNNYTKKERTGLTQSNFTRSPGAAVRSTARFPSCRRILMAPSNWDHGV